MEVTEVRITLQEHTGSDSKAKSLRAVGSVTFDNAFTVHGIKIIERREDQYGNPREPMVCMPAWYRCPHCNNPNMRLTAKYCSGCGKELDVPAMVHMSQLRGGHPDRVNFDICHPLIRELREHINVCVLTEYRRMLEARERYLVEEATTKSPTESPIPIPMMGTVTVVNSSPNTVIATPIPNPRLHCDAPPTIDSSPDASTTSQPNEGMEVKDECKQLPNLP